MFASRLIPRLPCKSTHFASKVTSPLTSISRNYAIKHQNIKKKRPAVRYIFGMFLLSSAFLYFVTGRVDKKKTIKTSFSEKEFNEYEEITGLKRRHKLFTFEMNEKYQFYVIPYVKHDESVETLSKQLTELDQSKKVKVINPVELLEQEKNDESKKYSFLLQDLQASNKSYPPGLVTAVIKEYLSFLLNTREGTLDTSFIIKNYPQTTHEAIKFENEISDIKKCIILENDVVNELSKGTDEEIRSIKNVDGYFNSVGKSTTITSDKKIKSIKLEDL
ncbi:Altered inheritance of mitochondria protein 36 mitochondrial [Spathaspora sp. JA1]|nr:Altered inheritance of mitochondria protein 36 mitochondrial [Spathaspora sp. JA1]